MTADTGPRAPLPATAPPIRLGYFLNIANIGDRMSPTIVGDITGRDTNWYRGREPRLLAVGSVLQTARAHDVVWGTGLLWPEHDLGGIDPARVLALRGKLTHAALSRHCGKLPDMPLGDPGFLLAQRHCRAADEPRYRLGIAAHYDDAMHPAVQALCALPGVTLIDATEPPDRYFARLADCAAVAGSSLHGLIFAEALGIPNLWVRFARLPERLDFKYHDWFSTTARPQKEATIIAGDEDPEALARQCRLHESRIDRQELTGALTSSALDACSEGQRRPDFIPVAKCRQRPVPAFLISFNRPRALRNSIAALRELATPVEIVILDNGGASPKMQATLAEFEHRGLTVYQRPVASYEPKVLPFLSDSIADFFARWGEPVPYIIGDCRVGLGPLDPRLLEILDFFLRRLPDVDWVGPTPTRPAPAGQPQAEPERLATPWGRIAYRRITTKFTFALHRAGFRPKLKRPGVLLGVPFAADDAQSRETDYGSALAAAPNGET